jgi:hypothetical protein
MIVSNLCESTHIVKSIGALKGFRAAFLDSRMLYICDANGACWPALTTVPTTSSDGAFRRYFLTDL